MPEVAKAARDVGNRDAFVPAHAMKTLTLMLEARSSLSTTSQQTMRDVARDALSARHFIVLAAACDLAIATGDSGLRPIVEQLATSAAAVRGRGVTEEAVSFVQKKAAEALSRVR